MAEPEGVVGVNLWDHAAAVEAQIAEAVAARDEGIARAAARAPDLATVGFDALRFVAAHQELVTSEDVWARLAVMGFGKPAEARGMGYVMRRGVREGVIAFSHYGRSTDPAHHRDIQTVFRSVR